MSGKECNCGKAFRNRRKRPNDELDIDMPVIASKQKVVATCPTCTEALIGSNGRKYPLHLVPMDVHQNEVDHWIKNGYNIIVERPSYDH